MKLKRCLPILLLISFLAIHHETFAQEEIHPEGNAGDLAKKLSNPVASMISVPLQNNTDYGIGSNNGVRNTLNIQPVVPFALSPKYNLVTRYIIPLVSTYDVHGEGTSQTGLGDATISAFFAPAESKMIWGVGPAFLVPIATDELLGTKKFCVGPTALVAKQTTSGWTIGALANQLWSVAGDDQRPDVSQLYFQPFIVHNWKSGAGVGVNFEMTENWKAIDDGLTLSMVPTVSGVTKLGKQIVSLLVGPRIPLAGADGVKPNWGWRGSMTFVFSK